MPKQYRIPLRTVCSRCVFQAEGRCNGPDPLQRRHSFGIHIGCTDIEKLTAAAADLSFHRRHVGTSVGPPIPILPSIVPVLSDGGVRGGVLPASRVFAVGLSSVLKLEKSGLRVQMQSPEHMRKRLGVCPDAPLILMLNTHDDLLEKLWADVVDQRIWRQLIALDFIAVTTPTFSVYDRDPRSDQIIAMDRALVAYNVLVQLGVPVIPFCAAFAPEDYVRFGEFLGRHSEVSVVAFLAQQSKTRAEFGEVLKRIERAQKASPRSIRPLVVGVCAPAKLRLLFGLHSNVAIANSQLVMAAKNGRVLLPDLSEIQLPNEMQAVDAALHNIAIFEAFCEQQRSAAA